MRFSEEKGFRVYRFDSFEEYLHRASDPSFKINKHGDSRWGEPLFDEMLHNARHGWTKTLEDIERWTNMIVEDISGSLPKPEIEYDKVGTMWDLSRIIEGDPDCWFHEEPSKDIDRGPRGSIVRMVINTAASFGVFQNSHKHRCGAILALTTLLEKVGFFVQFEVTTALSGTVGGKLEFRTIAKTPGEALNIGAISFWCSSQMERHIDFAICETMRECNPSWSTEGTLYGYPQPTADRGDICFDGMALDNADNCDWNDEQSVRRYVKAQLHKQGIKLQ